MGSAERMGTPGVAAYTGMDPRLCAVFVVLLVPAVAQSTAAAPTMCPNGGSHVGMVQKLRLASTTAGASIYYTTDGTPPTASSTLYTAPFDTVTSTSNITAIAIKSGFTNSPTTSRLFTVTTGTLSTQVAAPVFSQNGGAVKLFDKISITSASDTDIYWTAGLNYTVPTACNWASKVKGLVVINFSSKTTSKVVV